MRFFKHSFVSVLFVIFSLIAASNSAYSKSEYAPYLHHHLSKVVHHHWINASDPTVGSISGKLKVTRTGALNYSIPISISPGTAGMSPALTIAYNSQQKNGLLGMGFSLKGLTAITRAPQNYAQNGKIHGIDFTKDDRFALDGQQLVAVKGDYGADGTEYRTYIDSGAKIISYGQSGNGPASFRVWTKGGQIAEYAVTTDSQVKAQVEKPDGTLIDGQTAKMWALDKIEDRAGNYLTIHYHNDPTDGSFYPTEIDYTGNDPAKLAPYNSIKFTYEDRPDIQTQYHAGSKTTLNKRLSEI